MCTWYMQPWPRSTSVQIAILLLYFTGRYCKPQKWKLTLRIKRKYPVANNSSLFKVYYACHKPEISMWTNCCCTGTFCIATYLNEIHAKTDLRLRYSWIPIWFWYCRHTSYVLLNKRQGWANLKNLSEWCHPCLAVNSRRMQCREQFNVCIYTTWNSAQPMRRKATPGYQGSFSLTFMTIICDSFISWRLFMTKLNL